MHNQFTEDETNVVILFLLVQKTLITILVANYNNKNNNNNKNASSSNSSSTTTYLATHDFNLLYSRRLRPKPNNNNNSNNNNDNDDDGEGEEEEEEFIATLISINPISGILEAKIEPSASRGGGRRRCGKTHEEAFSAFKRYVEVILGEVLRSVPDAVAAAAATTVSSSPSEITIEQQQPPPAYEVGRNALSIEGGGGVGKF